MREKIKLVSSAGTGHFYTTTKNKKTMPKIDSKEKLNLEDKLDENTKTGMHMNDVFDY